MKVKFCVAVAAIMIACSLSLVPSTAGAYDMLEYWPVEPGTVWILDHEILILSAKTQTFGSFEGKQLFMASTFCDGPCGHHAYIYAGPEGLMGVGLHEDGKTIDLSATPFKIAGATMDIGDEVVSTIPAGVLDDEDAITLKAKLLKRDFAIVPAGTFTDALVLEFRIDDDPGSEYVERLWLAKNVGPVKIQRVSESPEDHEGCFFTCGSFDQDEDIIRDRVIRLEDVLGLSLFDVNKDGQLNLDDAIYILQVLSGNRS